MKQAVYKLEFKTGVHFGNEALSSNNSFFKADTLFSALYIEAIKLGLSDELLQNTKSGKILISDAFPYIGDTYYISKPMVYIEKSDRGDSKLKKAYKNLKYVPVQLFDKYLNADINPDECSLNGLGCEYDHIMASVGVNESDTEPYSVGTFFFAKDSGLYIIAEFCSEDEKSMFEELMDCLSYSGIGGKRSAGKGRFIFRIAKNTEALITRQEGICFFQQRCQRMMSLMTVLSMRHIFCSADQVLYIRMAMPKQK